MCHFTIVLGEVVEVVLAGKENRLVSHSCLLCDSDLRETELMRGVGHGDFLVVIEIHQEADPDIYH